MYLLCSRFKKTNGGTIRAAGEESNMCTIKQDNVCCIINKSKQKRGLHENISCFAE